MTRALAAAARMLHGHARSSVTFAELADESGVPEAELRALFATEDRIAVVVLETIFRHLQERLVRQITATPSSDPLVQYAALIHGFVDWAIDNPAAYRLLQAPEVNAIVSGPTLRGYMDSVTIVARSRIEALHAAGRIRVPFDDYEDLQMTLRATLEGVIRAVVDGLGERWRLALHGRDEAHLVVDIVLRALYVAEGEAP